MCTAFTEYPTAYEISLATISPTNKSEDDVWGLGLDRSDSSVIFIAVQSSEKYRTFRNMVIF